MEIKEITLEEFFLREEQDFEEEGFGGVEPEMTAEERGTTLGTVRALTQE